MNDSSTGKQNLTRRERLRQATLEEIVDSARVLLHGSNEVTMRAIATEMGISPPGLYRYVDSVATLNDLVTEAIFDDLLAVIRAATGAYDGDPAARLVAAAGAFRSWALANHAEFQHVFASSAPREGRSPGAMRFAEAFATIFLDLWKQRPFPTPSPDELDEKFVAVRGLEVRREPLHTVSSDAVPPGLIWLFELGWTKLYGIVALEVFGHVEPPLVESGALFEAQLRELGVSVGLDDQLDRLVQVARSVCKRQPA